MHPTYPTRLPCPACSAGLYVAEDRDHEPDLDDASRAECRACGWAGTLGQADRERQVNDG